MTAAAPLIDRRRGAPIVAIGMLLVSTESLLIRLAEADPFDIAVWVGAVTAAAIGGWVTIVGDEGVVARCRRGGRPLVIATLLQTATTLCFIVALTRTSVSNVVVIIATAPLLAMAAAWVFLREQPTRRTVVAVVCSLVGIAIVISGSVGGGSPGGDAFAVAAIAAYALGLVVLRSNPQVDPLLVVGCGGAVMSVVTAWPAQLLGHEPRTWAAIAAMGLFTGPVSRVLLATAPRYLPASEVSLFVPIETVLAPLWAYLALDEVPTVRTVIGGVVIVVAVLYAVWPRAGSDDAESSDASAEPRVASGG